MCSARARPSCLNVAPCCAASFKDTSEKEFRAEVLHGTQLTLRRGSFRYDPSGTVVGTSATCTPGGNLVKPFKDGLGGRN